MWFYSKGGAGIRKLKDSTNAGKAADRSFLEIYR